MVAKLYIVVKIINYLPELKLIYKYKITEFLLLKM